MAAALSDIDKWNLLQTRSQEARVRLAFELYRSHGIEPILIKGWAAARNYPSGHDRRPGDVDLAVAPGDFPRAEELRKRSEFSPLLIDLHCGLRHLDTLKWEDIVSRSELVDLDGSEIRVLCPEDHLRVLCVHWLTDGGAYRERLWDIYYAVTHRPSDFDWSRCLDVVDHKRRSWVICTIAIAHKYLGLEIDDLPIAGEARAIPRWVSRCVEREWARSRLEPVLTSVHDRELLWEQVRRRMPPNPIRATIEANGDLYGPMRWWYQFLVITRRLGPFLRDTLFALRIYSRKGEPRPEAK